MVKTNIASYASSGKALSNLDIFYTPYQSRERLSNYDSNLEAERGLISAHNRSAKITTQTQNYKKSAYTPTVNRAFEHFSELSEILNGEYKQASGFRAKTWEKRQLHINSKIIALSSDIDSAVGIGALTSKDAAALLEIAKTKLDIRFKTDRYVLSNNLQNKYLKDAYFEINNRISFYATNNSNSRKSYFDSNSAQTSSSHVSPRKYQTAISKAHSLESKLKREKARTETERKNMRALRSKISNGAEKYHASVDVLESMNNSLAQIVEESVDNLSEAKRLNQIAYVALASTVAQGKRTRSTLESMRAKLALAQQGRVSAETALEATAPTIVAANQAREVANANYQEEVAIGNDLASRLNSTQTQLNVAQTYLARDTDLGARLSAAVDAKNAIATALEEALKAQRRLDDKVQTLTDERDQLRINYDGSQQNNASLTDVNAILTRQYAHAQSQNNNLSRSKRRWQYGTALASIAALTFAGLYYFCANKKHQDNPVAAPLIRVTSQDDVNTSSKNYSKLPATPGKKASKTQNNVRQNTPLVDFSTPNNVEQDNATNYGKFPSTTTKNQNNTQSTTPKINFPTPDNTANNNSPNYIHFPTTAPRGKINFDTTKKPDYIDFGNSNTPKNNYILFPVTTNKLPPKSNNSITIPSNNPSKPTIVYFPITIEAPTIIAPKIEPVTNIPKPFSLSEKAQVEYNGLLSRLNGTTFASTPTKASIGTAPYVRNQIKYLSWTNFKTYTTNGNNAENISVLREIADTIASNQIKVPDFKNPELTTIAEIAQATGLSESYINTLADLGQINTRNNNRRLLGLIPIPRTHQPNGLTQIVQATKAGAIR